MQVNNKKTTIAGYLSIAASVLGWFAAVFSGVDIQNATTAAAGGVAAGVGLVSAQDGKH